MQYETIIVEKRDGVAIITLNRPEKLNGVNLEMRLEVLDVLDELEVDDETRVVIVTGAGRAFCAGANISRFGEDSVELLKSAVAEPCAEPCIGQTHITDPLTAHLYGYSSGHGRSYHYITRCSPLEHFGRAFRIKLSR